jgi:hypothetical protein
MTTHETIINNLNGDKSQPNQPCEKTAFPMKIILGDGRQEIIPATEFGKPHQNDQNTPSQS